MKRYDRFRETIMPKGPQNCVPKLRALADQTRWRIVETLLDRELTVSELVRRLRISQSNVSKHLRVLRDTGIVTSQRKGKTVRCRVSPKLRAQFKKDGALLDLGCCQFRFSS